MGERALIVELPEKEPEPVLLKIFDLGYQIRGCRIFVECSGNIGFDKYNRENLLRRIKFD